MTMQEKVVILRGKKDQFLNKFYVLLVDQRLTFKMLRSFWCRELSEAIAQVKHATFRFATFLILLLIFHTLPPPPVPMPQISQLT